MLCTVVALAALSDAEIDFGLPAVYNQEPLQSLMTALALSLICLVDLKTLVTNNCIFFLWLTTLIPVFKLPMDDGWKNIREELSKKKTISTKRRQLEMHIRSETIRDMYHGVIESVIQLYKDNRSGLNSWQHFRAVADKLTEMHKFMKLTVTKVYELGTAEGAANYFYDFFEKVRDVHGHAHGQYIPFEYLRDYLSQPDDPPPKPLRRAKRLVKRIHSSAHVQRRTTPTASAAMTLALPVSNVKPYATTVPPASSSTALFPTDNQAPSVKKARLFPVEPGSHLLLLPNSSSLSEPDTCLSEDSSGSVSSCCNCAECLTETSSSANEDEDTSSQRFEHFRDTMRSMQNFPSR
ncbi:hypothetical protein PHET_05814 [Paragonimus heterotremus]|uniref:Uncharacterized protein n=1 Tax=Paragonimus heterotremus TaxID=100268 RepID=A0A8J4SZT9_9TREM|nr:hypothetical protein PHET_05814 [Paragonimus heterotremus]